jgi:hypothetical protein
MHALQPIQVFRSIVIPHMMTLIGRERGGCHSEKCSDFSSKTPRLVIRPSSFSFFGDRSSVTVDSRMMGRPSMLPWSCVADSG